MIVDTQKRWVVCTPAKCGSKSITAALREVSDKLTPMNRVDYEGDEGMERLMCVRHPLDRWTSMYLWAARDGAWGHKYAVEGLVPYAEHFRETAESGGITNHDSDVMWMWTQARMARGFKPTGLFDNVSDGGRAMLAYLSEKYGYELADTMPPINVTKGRPPANEVLDLLPASLRIWLVNYYDEDFEWFTACGLTYPRY